MRCERCGEKVYGDSYFCPKCEEEIKNMPELPPEEPQPYNPPPGYDMPNAGWKLLSFCFPVIGLIMYFVLKSDKPLTAKALKRNVIIGFIFYFVLSFLLVLIPMIFFNGANPGYDYYYKISFFANRLNFK